MPAWYAFCLSRKKYNILDVKRGQSMVIYLDNAATTWPKPQTVAMAMKDCIEQYGANPGRGGHKMSVQASRTLFETRVLLSKLFHIQNPNDIMFTLNTTAALNQAIQGFVKPGDHHRRADRHHGKRQTGLPGGGFFSFS